MSAEESFARSEPPFQLAAGEAHCWWISLEAPAQVVAGLERTLSPDEHARSERFRFERDRRRFIVARGVLRELLGRYLGSRSREISFVYNASGKPDLGPEFATALKFNVSHSGGLAVVALAGGSDIGVDVEYIRPEPDYVEIARRFFSPDEVEYLARLPGDVYAEAFFGIWTKKEAYVKARGEGLGIALNSFSVPRGTEPAQTTVELEANPWSVHTLRPAPGYVAAVALEGSGWHLRQSHWAPPRS